MPESGNAYSVKASFPEHFRTGIKVAPVVKTSSMYDSIFLS